MKKIITDWSVINISMVQTEEKHIQTNRKKRILEAAITLFLEKDYGEVTTEMIAKRANVSKGLVFMYYNTKLNLAIEALKSIFSEYLHETPETIPETLSEESLKKLISTNLNALISFPGITRFFLQVLAHLDKEESDMLVRLLVQPIIDAAKGVFEHHGYPYAETLARILVGSMDGIALQIMISDWYREDSQNLESVINVLSRMIWFEIKNFSDPKAREGGLESV